MDVTGAGAKGTVVVTDAALRERERENSGKGKRTIEHFPQIFLAVGQNQKNRCNRCLYNDGARQMRSSF